MSFLIQLLEIRSLGILMASNLRITRSKPGDFVFNRWRFLFLFMTSLMSQYGGLGASTDNYETLLENWKQQNRAVYSITTVLL